MLYRCPIKQEISSYIISKCAHSLIYNHRISFSITDHCFLFNDFQLTTNPSFFFAIFIHIYIVYTLFFLFFTIFLYFYGKTGYRSLTHEKLDISMMP